MFYKARYGIKLSVEFLLQFWFSRRSLSLYYGEFYIYDTKITLLYKRLPVFHSTPNPSAQNSTKTRYQIRTVVERKHRTADRHKKCKKKQEMYTRDQKWILEISGVNWVEMRQERVRE